MNNTGFALVMRHKVATGICLLLGAIAVALTFLLISPTYSLQASFVLTYPDTQTTSRDRELISANPFLRYSDNSTVSQTLAARVNGGSVADAFTTRHPSTTYAVTTSTDLNASPQILYVSLQAPTQAEATDSLSVLAETMSAQLREIQQQAGASGASLIGLQQAAIPRAPVPSFTNRIRTIVGIGILTLFGAAGILLILDRRKQHH